MNITMGSVGGNWKELKLEGTSEDHKVQAASSKQGQLEQFAEGHDQLASEYLQESRLHNLSRQSVPVFDRSHSKNTFSHL